MALFKMVNGQNVQMSKEEEAEIQAEWDQWAIDYENTSYITQRQVSYPPITDQLDAIWKQLQSTPEALLPEVKVISDQVLQVKEDFPKPIEDIKI